MQLIESIDPIKTAFSEPNANFPTFTKNTEVRENYDNERSIHGIEAPIKGRQLDVNCGHVKFANLENTSRYGANKTKHLSVKGSVPRVEPRDPLLHQTQVFL